MAKLSSISAAPRDVAPSWFATDVRADYHSDRIRFRAGIRCSDGDLLLCDLMFRDYTLHNRAISNSRREVLQALHEHIVKELATLELDKE